VRKERRKKQQEDRDPIEPFEKEKDESRNEQGTTVHYRD
jgi:hypothetical protein